MTPELSKCSRTECIALCVIMILFAVLSIVGITWGLPTRKIDNYLFGDATPWSGEKIYRLANADEKFSASRGADVDADPVDEANGEPVLLTATESDAAKIYLRYRLYTHQPDEMITMMALAGMSPRSLDLDPRLYQYGGLFIYPVGALIKLCGVVGLIDVRSDVAYYLEHPSEFGKFYVVARAYSALWGLLGVCVVFAIARRLGGSRAAIMAALLFAIMPVVVCMAHEGKPHLPGAVLMLLAVLFAMRHLSRDPFSAPASTGSRDWWMMCVCCGAAFGMVLSSWPIFVLIPLVAWLGRLHAGSPAKLALGEVTLTYVLQRTVVGTLVAIAVYLITNPYILINAVTNREVLQSNFGNSLAMYQISRIAEGFVRVIELTIEGAALPILALGVVATVIAVIRRNATMLPLAVAAAVFFMQFVFIGAGKPGEYGRFGIFTNTALAIGAACLLTQPWSKRLSVVRPLAALLAILWTGACGGSYLRGFSADASDDNSRTKLARRFAGITRTAQGQDSSYAVAVLADPAPYGCPPMNFASTNVLLVKSPAQAQAYFRERRGLFLQPSDSSEMKTRGTPLYRLTLAVCPWAAARNTSISWANKPFIVDWPTGATDPTPEE